MVSVDGHWSEWWTFESLYRCADGASTAMPSSRTFPMKTQLNDLHISSYTFILVTWPVWRHWRREDSRICPGFDQGNLIWVEGGADAMTSQLTVLVSYIWPRHICLLCRVIIPIVIHRLSSISTWIKSSFYGTEDYTHLGLLLQYIRLSIKA